jgi:histone H3/H4
LISFVTGEAKERCHTEHNKTVTTEDVVWAMDHLGFDDYSLRFKI